jgi:hypothetical protein
MITHSPTIAVTLAVDMTALLLYNVAGMAVTGHLGAVFRTVLETGRTLFVWIVDLALFYGVSSPGEGRARLGESWSSWSWMQLGGFAVLVAGTLVYGRGDDAEAVAAAAEAGEAAAAEAGEEQVIAAAAPPLPSASDQLLPPAPSAAGPSLPVTMSRRMSTSTPISVIGTPMSFKVGGKRRRFLFFHLSLLVFVLRPHFCFRSKFRTFFPFEKKKQITEHDEHQPLFLFLHRCRVPDRVVAAGLVGPRPRLVADREVSAEREQRSLRVSYVLLVPFFSF